MKSFSLPEALFFVGIYLSRSRSFYDVSFYGMLCNQRNLSLFIKFIRDIFDGRTRLERDNFVLKSQGIWFGASSITSSSESSPFYRCVSFCFLVLLFLGSISQLVDCVFRHTIRVLQSTLQVYDYMLSNSPVTFGTFFFYLSSSQKVQTCRKKRSGVVKCCRRRYPIRDLKCHFPRVRARILRRLPAVGGGKLSSLGLHFLLPRCEKTCGVVWLQATALQERLGLHICLHLITRCFSKRECLQNPHLYCSFCLSRPQCGAHPCIHHPKQTQRTIALVYFASLVSSTSSVHYLRCNEIPLSSPLYSK